MKLNFFSKSTNSNDVSTVFDNQKNAICAEHAYQKSRFGCLKTDKELLNEFFGNVRSMIENKNIAGKFSGIIEVNSDIIQFMPKIMDKLTNDLGYKAVVLDDNVEIINKTTNVKSEMNTGSTFIILIWNKEAIKNVRKTNEYVDIENLNKLEENNE